MALLINDACINCDACVPVCPNAAIYIGGEEYEYNGQNFPALSEDFYYIVPEKCTECVGFNDKEQCVSVCPTDACVKDPAHVEAREALLEKARLLHPDQAI